MTKKPKRKEGMILEEIDGDFILADFERSRMHMLNPMAAVIWDLCDGQKTVEDIADVLIAEFSIEPARARAELEHIIEEFRKADLFE